MKRLLLVLFLGIWAQYSFAQTTYYSRNAGSGGNWNAAASWTLSADGSGPAASVPGRNDRVVILSGHTISINNTNDNGSSGVSPDGLALANVGAFAGSGTACFYQLGNIEIVSGGTVTSSTRLMLDGSTIVSGTMTSTGDIINLGYMSITQGATFSTDDDIILSGTSRTTFYDLGISSDDIYLDHTDALLCGTDTINIGVSSPNTPIINYVNGATLDQICTGITITCGPDPGCSGFPVTGTGNFSLDLASFNFYKQLTIQSSQVPSDLTDFPLLVSFSDPDIRTLSDGGAVENSNGFDIMFSTTNDCENLSFLDHQIESYSSNVTTGTIVAWVRIPFLSSTVDTDIFMYYGYSGGSKDVSVSSVFDADYSNVYHLHSDFNDATLNGNNGTNSGTTNASGKIGDGQSIGTNNYIQVPTTDMSVSQGTISIWSHSTSFSGAHQYLIGHTTTPIFANRIQLYTDDVGGNLDLGFGNSHSLSTGIFTFNTTDWYYVTLTWNGGNYNVYVNETLQDNSTYAGFTTLETFLDIGNDGASTLRNEGWIGELDEVRISTIERSADWITTEFRNQNDPNTFFTVGIEIPVGCAPLPIKVQEFFAQKVEKGNRIEFSISSTENSFAWTLQRSDDLKTWIDLKEAEIVDHAHEVLSFHFIDQFPGRHNYYRLKFSEGAELSFSKIVFMENLAGPDLQFSPNPTKGRITFEHFIRGEATIQIQDTKGELKSFTYINEQEIDISGLETGVYFITIIRGGQLIRKKVIKL